MEKVKGNIKKGYHYNSFIIDYTSWRFLFLLIFGLIWIDSLLGTTNIANWFLENTLTLISVLFLLFTFKKHPLSNVSYFFVLLFLCLHIYGSKYTYSYNPFGFWLQDTFESSRNHYDRLVHFSFGLLLYYPIYEYYCKWLGHKKNISQMISLLILISLGGLYEIMEWLFACIFFREQGVSYLGIQGDVWDAQKDMSLSTIGALIAIILHRLFSHFFKSKSE